MTIENTEENIENLRTSRASARTAYMNQIDDYRIAKEEFENQSNILDTARKKYELLDRRLAMIEKFTVIQAPLKMRLSGLSKSQLMTILDTLRQELEISQEAEEF